MFTAQEILLLLEIPSETNNIEFKEAKNNYDDNKLGGGLGYRLEGGFK